MSGVLVDRAALENVLDLLATRHVFVSEVEAVMTCQTCGAKWSVMDDGQEPERHAPRCPVATLRAALSTPAPAGAVAGGEEVAWLKAHMAYLRKQAGADMRAAASGIHIALQKLGYLEGGEG